MTRTILNRYRKHGVILAAGFLMSGLLLAAPSALSQDGRADPRAALRKDPDYARLYHDGKAFLALPAAKQEAMRTLHSDLQKLPRGERERLKEALTRYADWLDRLEPEERRAVVNAKTYKGRLQSIKRQREKEWLARQPVAVRQYLNKLPPSKPAPAVAAASVAGLPPLALATALIAQSTDLRAETVSRLKREESRKSRDWVIASRHWLELTDPKKTMPVHPADFGNDVETFVKEYLVPMLDKAELARLNKAEGQWPLYPMTLVELADKHPMALPQKRGPTAFKDLPGEVQKRLAGKLAAKDGKTKNVEAILQKQGNAKDIEARLAVILPQQDRTPAIKFACSVATYAHSLQPKKGGVKLPHELWAAQAKDMSVSMQVFLDKKGSFWLELTPEEHGELLRAEGKWPEYPHKVQELAVKYGFRPPWQSLPDIDKKGDVWDKYRVKQQKG
jgi:hypothetical protein